MNHNNKKGGTDIFKWLQKKGKEESEEMKTEADIKQVETIFDRYGLERESEVVTAKIYQYQVA